MFLPTPDWQNYCPFSASFSRNGPQMTTQKTLDNTLQFYLRGQK
jgi:hypothetical protein